MLNILIQEADEESEDSSEDDIDLEFDERAKISKLKVLIIFSLNIFTALQCCVNLNSYINS